MDALLTSLDLALDFLAASGNTDGLWMDFRVNDGSDEYVTAYVGTILAGSGMERAVALAREAWKSFGPRNFFDRSGGWGWNQFLPEDADSTAWGLKYAISLGLGDTMRAHAAADFLRLHLTLDEGLASYTATTAFSELMRKNMPPDVSGWLAAHPCVTAAAALIPSFNDTLVPYLLRNQLPHGGWGAYWTTDTVFTTAFAIEALHMHGPFVHRDAIARAGEWVSGLVRETGCVTSSRHPSGSPFATALALRALTGTGNREHGPAMRKMADWLVHSQKRQGCWTASATLRVPAPWIRASCRSADLTGHDTEHSIPVYTDPLAVFTTATVFDALNRYADITGSTERNRIPAAGR